MKIRVLLAASAAIAAAMALPAQAAPPVEGPYAAPYDSARPFTHVSCSEGATCTPEASATADGAVSGAVSYSRSQAATGTESLSAQGLLAQTVRLPHKADAATITLVWRVAEATSDATSTAGSVFAGTYVWGQAFCNGCSNTYKSQLVSYCGSSVVGPCAPTTGPSASGTTHTLILKLTDVRGQFVSVTSGAGAYAGAKNTCLVFGATSCEVESPRDTHAGTASSSINASLESISVTAG